MADRTVTELNSDLKVPLSPTFIALWLRQGKTKADIARIAGVSRAAVTLYCQDHHEALAPLLQTDEYQALLNKAVSLNASGKIYDILNKESFSKKDIVPLNIISGTHQDKNRDSKGQSIQVDVRVLDQNQREIAVRVTSSLIDSEIERLRSGAQPVNNEVIEADYSDNHPPLKQVNNNIISDDDNTDNNQRVE